jgi:hypothetical protein
MTSGSRIRVVATLTAIPLLQCRLVRTDLQSELTVADGMVIFNATLAYFLSSRGSPGASKSVSGDFFTAER